MGVENTKEEEGRPADEAIHFVNLSRRGGEGGKSACACARCESVIGGDR